MSINWEKVDIKELAAIISSQLNKNNIEVVLVGGACVSLYSNNQYLSYDIDLVTDTPIRKISPVLGKLGFISTGGRLFQNPKCKFLIDFPAPPVSIGDGPVLRFNNLKTRFGVIQLLTPTDCVKDRLAAYFFWNDRQSLDQAIMVSKAKKVSFTDIKKWAEKQGEIEKYKEFIKKCKAIE
jgi:hypothetical protein